MRGALGADSFSASEVVRVHPFSPGNDNSLILSHCPAWKPRGLLETSILIEEFCLLYLNNSSAFTKENSQRDKKSCWMKERWNCSQCKSEYQKRSQYCICSEIKKIHSPRSSVISRYYTIGEALGHFKVTKWQLNILASSKYSWKHNWTRGVLYSVDTLCKDILYPST